jgi:hypothetical protein
MLTPLLLLALTLKVPALIPETQRGTWLYQACQGAQRFLDNPYDAKTSADQGSNFDNCTAYLAGYLEGPTAETCPTAESTMGTYVRVYVLFMQKHPKLLDMWRSVGLQEAMRDAYPCSKK